MEASVRSIVLQAALVSCVLTSSACGGGENSTSDTDGAAIGGTSASGAATSGSGGTGFVGAGGTASAVGGAASTTGGAAATWVTGGTGETTGSGGAPSIGGAAPAGGVPGSGGASSGAPSGGASGTVPSGGASSGGVSADDTGVGGGTASGSGTGGLGVGGTSTGGADSVGGEPLGGANSGGSDAAGGAPVGGMESGGGDAVGGAETGGGASAEAWLITSAEDDYWNTDSALTVNASGPANLTVDEESTYQQWDGFGGTFNEMGWDALQAISAEIPRALELLFSAQDGANFVYGRLPVGASDYSMSWYTLAETANDYAMEHFSIERDREMLIPYVKAALEVRPDLHLWGSPWVVPDWMMDSGRNMRSDSQTQGAHALYLAKFVEEYSAEGITIEAVHPQNEPGYARVHWDQQVLIDYFKTYLGPTFVERGLSTQLWCGTMSHPDDANIAIGVANDPEAMQYVTGFGLQWNHTETVAELAPAGRVMQTEHRCGNYSFTAPYWDQSRYSSSTPQNDHLYGEESWQLIRDWIVGGVNSYLAWNMVLDTQGRSLDGWPQNSLLVVDRSASRLVITAAYYAFRHYSQYLAQGATRIGVAGSEDALAFRNPDGSIVTQVYNQGAADVSTTIDVRGALYQFDLPAHGWATLRVTP